MNVLYNTAMDKKRKNQSNLEAENAASKKAKDSEAEKVRGDFVQASLYQTKRGDLLLGEFSADGKYSLTDDKLLQELVTLPKVLQERVDNVAYAYTKYDGFNLNFRIDMDISESYCSAEIFLIEIEHGVEEDIKHLTSLGNFVEMYSPSFKDNVYKAWNINLQETPLDKDNVVFKNLWELESEYSFSKELIEILSQLYIVRLLKLLDGCGTLGLKIQGDYRALVEELIKKDPSLAQDHTRLKKILDQMIEKHNGFDVILSKPEGVEILKNFSEPITRVTGRIAPDHVEKIEFNDKKPDAKPAENKAAPKKKKAKAKGGDSGKPFVWAIKNYKPQVLVTPDEAKKTLPSKETKAPIETTETTQTKMNVRKKSSGGNKFSPSEKNDEVAKARANEAAERMRKSIEKATGASDALKVDEGAALGVNPGLTLELNPFISMDDLNIKKDIAGETKTSELGVVPIVSPTKDK